MLVERNIPEAISLEKLAGLPYVEQVFLFGSRATKTNRERSDIDIAINCPQANLSDWLKIVDIIDDSPTLLKIDCIHFDRLHNSSELRKEILKEGVLLYDKRKTDC